MDARIIYNTIGICIINTDRIGCLARLLDSMARKTDPRILQEIKVNVVDDSSSPKVIENFCKSMRFINFIHTGERIGIARNTNRALKLLQNKEFSFIFNNDCEILKEKWINFYYDAAIKTGLHHLCFQQEGIWGAGTDRRPEERNEINGVAIKTLHDFPQGALLVYDKIAFQKVGYFDAKTFRGYGKSHWDWSFRISESGIQPKGIHDIIGSNEYFKVHDEKCVTDPAKRASDYRRNTEIYNQKISEVRLGTRPIFMEYNDG